MKCVFKTTSVAYVVGPSVNTFSVKKHMCTILELKISKFSNVNELNWFFLPNPIFAICLNFLQHNPLKNQYLPHLSSENCEINSIKSDSSKAFQEHQENPQIPIKIFSVDFI